MTFCGGTPEPVAILGLFLKQLCWVRRGLGEASMGCRRWFVGLRNSMVLLFHCCYWLRSAIFFSVVFWGTWGANTCGGWLIWVRQVVRLCPSWIIWLDYAPRMVGLNDKSLNLFDKFL